MFRLSEIVRALSGKEFQGDDIVFRDFVVEDLLLFRGFDELQLILLDEALHVELGFLHRLVGDIHHLADVLTVTDPDLDGQIFALTVFAGIGILLQTLQWPCCLFFFFFLYLAALGLSCGMWDL